MTEPKSLLIAPFTHHLLVPELGLNSVPPDPISSSSEASATLDPFTRTLWECHEYALKANKRTSLFSMKQLMADSYYIHVVKELHQPGHLERSGLQHSNPLMYLSIKNKFARNVRFMLFDIDPSKAKLAGLDVASVLAPLLYIVKREAMTLMSPTPEQCKRVIPISQVRPLLERLHREGNCRVVGIEKKVAQEYIGITRSTMRWFQNFCLTCKEHQPLNLRQNIVHPIRSLHARHRYIIDLIHMPDCNVPHEGTYRYIVSMVDHFSRYRWTAAIQEKYASVVLRELRQWWSMFGKPDILQSDNGPEFAAAELRELCNKWGVEKRRSRPYKPSTNGSVERANRDIEERLARWQTRNVGKTWVEGLVFITQAHNNCWTRCHNGKPCDALKMPPEPFRVAMLDDAAQQLFRDTVNNEEDRETDTEADRESALQGEEYDEDDEEGEDQDEDFLRSRRRGEVLESDDVDVDADMVGDDDQIHKEGLAFFMKYHKVDVSESESVASVNEGIANDRQKSGEPQQSLNHGPKPIAPTLPAVEQQRREEGKEEMKVEEKVKEEAKQALGKKRGEEAKKVSKGKAKFSRAVEESDGDSVVSAQHPLLGPAGNLPDEEGPPLDEMGIVLAGRLEGMRYPQWKRISQQIWERLGRFGVPAKGDCGVIAPLAAHQSFYLQGKSTSTITDAEILEQRSTAEAFLDKNLARIQGDPHLAVSVNEMRSTLRGLRIHVVIEYLWLYAMQHHINIYVIEVRVVREHVKKQTHSTFSVRLFTSDKLDLTTPIASDRPNTIAIYFHNIRDSGPAGSAQVVKKIGKSRVGKEMKSEGKEKEQRAENIPPVLGGMGHFECLVDKKSKASCWRTDDDIVKNVLQPALEESYRIAYLLSYTETWSRSHNRRIIADLPKISVGDLAMLMISDHMRKQSTYSSAVDGVGLRNMVVKVIAKRGNGTTGPTWYEVLSHHGVVRDWLLQQEFRVLGQDVDIQLRAREVTDSMRLDSAKVGLIQAWNFFLERRRMNHIEQMERQVSAAAEEVASASAEPLLEASSGNSDEGSVAPMKVEAEYGAKESAHFSPSIKPTLTLICCSCQQTINLAKGREPQVCVGLCQQPMHSSSGTCKGGREWVQVGNAGVCCSQACAALYLVVE